MVFWFVPNGLHWRALFGILGGGNEDGARYFSLFGGRIKLKPKPFNSLGDLWPFFFEEAIAFFGCQFCFCAIHNIGS